MVVAVAAVQPVDVTLDDVIDVPRMRHDGVAAADAMNVIVWMADACVPFRARHGITRRRQQFVLVDVLAVHVMEVPVVNVVDVVVVLDANVTALFPVPVFVIIMNVMLHGCGLIPSEEAQLTALRRASPVQAAHRPKSVRSWPVALKPRGSLASTVAQPSNS